MELEELKAIVIKERAKAAELGLQQDAAVAAMNATPEKAEVSRVIEAIRAQAVILQQAEDELRSLVLDRFMANGDKNPLPGISIKIFKQYVYDVQEARSWAMLGAPSLLVLDTKLFEKLAPDMPGAPIAVLDNPKVMLAKDLE
jgi:hypothetical protein